LVTDRYAETQADLLRAQEARRREFLSDLLHGHRRGAEALADAASLGIELLGESRVLVAGRRDPGHDLDDDAEKRVEDLFAPTPVLTVRIAGDLVVLPLGPADPSAVVEELGDVLVGDGRIHPGLDGIRNRSAEAREALSIARATGAGPVARFNELVLDRLLRQDPALLAEFVAQVVGVIQSYDARRRTDLLRTLEVWAAEGGRPTAAAEVLHVHPHTVTYRLGRVEELTGLSLSSPDHRLQILLGLRALRLLGSSFVSSSKAAREHSGPEPGENTAQTR
jgi:sugar diacid utilization regulator